ncbi:TPA: hypothetical protein N0F65_007206 [Lagenidium giganteum]|uniref:EF-hand domain-containing protein n=1 Tax=Lagenidium giganteum TaxID=4803 RepID=A0AAV2Z9S6_9STRA|nr:TPA: hypothetical protein N0F65_007206 [Lagenidium giganteum]
MNAVAVEGRFTVQSFLASWTEARLLTYKYSVLEDARPEFRTRVKVTFSKPTPAQPSPPAVAQFFFYLDDMLCSVQGFTVESEQHFHRITPDFCFDERLIDNVIRRKLVLQKQHHLNLDDEFSSTRLPSSIEAKACAARDREREGLEEQLMELFQQKDAYNDGRVPFSDFCEVLLELELPVPVPRNDRIVLFALIEQDREEMIDYGKFTPIGAEALEAMMHAIKLASDRATQQCKARGQDEDAEQIIQAIQSAAEEALHQFQVVSAGRVRYVVDKLNKMMYALVGGGPSDDADDEAAESDTGADAKDSGDDARPIMSISARLDKFISKRQLRECLEAPQLVLSKWEINLMMAVAETTATRQVHCAHVGPLYQKVAEAIFTFQRVTFADRMASYLSRQIEQFEASKLQGTQEYLNGKLKHSEMKMVVKDMKKLLLSPYQFMQVVALYEQGLDGDAVVRAQDCVPRLSEYLQLQVDPVTLQEKADAVHGMKSLTAGLFAESDRRLPSEDDVRAIVQHAFDTHCGATSNGVIRIHEFMTSMNAMANEHMPFLLQHQRVHQLAVLADPSGSGKVNTVYFMHIAYPLLRYMSEEDQVDAARVELRRRDTARREAKEAEAKG